MNRLDGKKLVEQKIEDFHANVKYYTSKDFQEVEARSRFIDPFFQALGWNFDQTNLPKHLWDVHREYRQKDNSRTKKPDYAFNIKGKLKYFVEAKAPWVPLTEKEPVFQAKRYAYSTNGKAPIVIITDFEEFRVFNAIERPNFDNPLQGSIKKLDLRYTDYLEKWDFLYDNFSKEAVADGSLNNLLGKITKNIKTLDKEFLDELIGWREKLARHLAVRNLNLNTQEINEAVQRILDRLVFIRNLEDREIEDNILFGLLKENESIYKKLLPVFTELNKDYNGLLFKPHYSENLIIDDAVIKKIIKNLYPPYSPFQFDVIEPEILGRIYEKFLGSKIRLTEKHQAKVEEKPEVRHAGGVYYTPQYIVDAIVEETVGKLVKGKKPEEISSIKILDPACGSGSFLIGSFSYLMKYHKEFYNNNKTIKKYKDDYYEPEDGEIQLSIKKKGDILVDNIFGVDIDREATEVAMMSLYLKLLEEGFDAEYKKQAVLFMRGFILPDLTSNILCGNSLINREQLFAYDMFGDEDITPFDWHDEKSGFGNIFNENGGFDIVIGNPPYIRIQEMQKWASKAVELYKQLYNAGSSKNYDIYVIFIEKALQLMSPNGVMGMILPNKFMQQEYGEKIRKQIVDGHHLLQIINFKDFQVFKDATTYTCLLFLTKSSNDNFKYSECSDENMILNFTEIKSSRISSSSWVLHSEEEMSFLECFEGVPKLGSLCDNIFVGIQTSADKIYILDYISETDLYYKLFSKTLNREVVLEKMFIRHIISGLDVKKYGTPFNRQYVIFPYIINDGKPNLISKKRFEADAPKIWAYLVENRKTLEDRESGKMKGEKWYGYVYLKNMALQNQPKICVPRLVHEIQAIYDENGAWCLDNVDVGGVILKTDHSHLVFYVLGMLNSKILNKYLSMISTPFRGGFWSCNRQYLEQLPIYLPDRSDKVKYDYCMKIEEYVKMIIELKKDPKKQADAEFLEKKIDEYVEVIYLR